MNKLIYIDTKGYKHVFAFEPVGNYTDEERLELLKEEATKRPKIPGCQCEFCSRKDL